MFYWLILGVSVAPYIILPAAFSGKSPPNTEMVRQTILFLANAHIAITLYLYWDKGFRSIINDNRTRYFTFPALAILGSAISYAATPGAYVFFWWAVYGMWQNWHFGKQTFGVYSFVSMDQTPGQHVALVERVLIYVAVTAGTLGTLWALGPLDLVKPYTIILRDVCGYVTLVLLVGALLYVFANHMPVKRAFFLIFSVLFFSPQYFASQGSVSFLHGRCRVQYPH